ncbi:MAG TPA: glycosyltransferase family A protein [Coleofasciculaceae cyanobacterium]|jgi:glycosyltransferase involved in cell wall biosynthesis
MNANPLVSVIMIFFNGEKFIEQAIESVLDQTYDNWELLLVDDGSTDNSTQIACRYIEKFPQKIRYLEHKNHQNKGMSATRNLGIANANGKYIAFLDADDVWLSHNLEQYLNLLNLQPQACMVYGNTLKWYSWTENSEDRDRDHLYDLKIDSEILVEPPKLFELLIKEKISAPCITSLVIKSEALQKIGGFAEEFRGMYEDQAFYAKIFLNHSVFITNAWGAKYRKHPDSCVSIARKTGQVNASHLFFLNWIEKYLLEQEVTDASIWKSLRQSLWAYHHPWLNKFKKKIFRLVGKTLPFSLIRS